MVEPAVAHWITAFEQDALDVGQARVLRHEGKQLAIFRTDPRTFYAIDNACPHEGYPLAQGYVKDCLLTCAWHNYKFDLRDGACVIGEEAVRSYPVRLEQGQVQVDMSDPYPALEIPKFEASLAQGLWHRRIGQAVRDAVRMLQLGAAPEELVLACLRFDSEYAEYGSTHALAVAIDTLRFLPRYPDLQFVYPLAKALDLTSEANVRQPKRERPEPIDPGEDPLDAGHRLRRAVEDEEHALAEGLLRGALARGWRRAEIEVWFDHLCADHFLDFAHPQIYQVKLFDFLDRIDWREADVLLGAHLFGILNATREDSLPPWKSFMERLAGIEDRFADWNRQRLGKHGGGLPRHSEDATRRSENEQRRGNPAALFEAIVDGRGQAWFETLVQQLDQGMPLEVVLDVLSQAAAMRVLRFDLEIDREIDLQEGWLDLTHRLTYAQAVREAVQRWHDPRALRPIFFAAQFINHARPLDAPAERRRAVDAALAVSMKSAADAPAADEEVDLAPLMQAIEARDSDRAVQLAAHYLQSGGPLEPLREALEDFALHGPVIRPIFAAHYTKTCLAAFDEYAAIRYEAGRPLPLLALVRFLSAPLRESRTRQIAYEAIGFVSEGKVPNRRT